MGVYEQHTPKSEGGLYLKLDDGQTVRVRIASEPVIFDSTFTQQNGDSKVSTRYAWLVWNVEEKVAQVLQQSATFYRSVANLAVDSDYGDPTKYDVKITRKGVGTDTVYLITPSPNKTELDDEAKEAIAKLDLPELVSKGQGVSNVFWLADFLDGGTETATKPAYDQSGYNKAKATADAIKDKKNPKDTVIEDIGDEPINLDDIPF